MSKAEELLNSVSEEVSVHTHPVTDTDTYFIIDPITRRIENTNRKKSVIMQYDHNSERFTFELPRFVDGHDMLECTSVTVNVDNIEVIESDGVEVVEPRVNSDAPDMTDLRVHPNDPDKVISSWLISRNSTQLAGILSFHIEYKCVDPNGDVVYEWGTDTYDEIEVKARKKNGEAIVTEHADLLEQWRTRIFGAGDSVMANITEEGNTQIAAVKAESETQQEAVELKGAQTLDSIPEDYTEVDAMADEAVRTKADAIICEAAGESIVLEDSSNDHVRGLKVLGKSTQRTTAGKNLFDIDAWLNNTGVEWAKSNDVYTVNTKVALHNNPFAFSDSDVEVTFSCKLTNKTTVNARFELLDSADNVTGYFYTEHASFTCKACKIRLNWTTTGDVEITTPQIELGSIATGYEPYTGGMPSPNPEYPQEIVSVENPKIIIGGSNLFDDASLRGQIVDSVHGNLSVYLAPGEYFASVSIIGDAIEKDATLVFYNTSKERIVEVNTRKDETFVVPETATSVNIYPFSGAVGGTWASVSINVAPYKLDYELYKPVQTLSITRTLPGIPVTSGGNYTDSDGQQWICDEIDFERGVYVQRVAKHTVTGTPAFNETADQPGRFSWNCLPEYFATGREVCLCNYAKWRAWGISDYKGVYDYGGVSVTQLYYSPAVAMTADEVNAKFAEMITNGNPPMVAAQLATPIETPLTAEEITAFKALRTNYPNTTILNDAGAWMSVKYNADTKLYIDNKITSAINAYLDAHLNQ